MPSIQLRAIRENDACLISQAFSAQGWKKPVAQYQQYYQEQQAGIKEVIVAEVEGEFAGYLTVVWASYYPPFREQNIPEVVDFNVLIKFRRQGVGAALMDEAERRIGERSDVAGIGVGLTADYGAAQILYVKRGYIPDGRGIDSNGRALVWGDQVTVDDDLNLHLLKRLR